MLNSARFYWRQGTKQQPLTKKQVAAWRAFVDMYGGHGAECTSVDLVHAVPHPMPHLHVILRVLHSGVLVGAAVGADMGEQGYKTGLRGIESCHYGTTQMASFP